MQWNQAIFKNWSMYWCFRQRGFYTTRIIETALIYPVHGLLSANVRLQ